MTFLGPPDSEPVVPSSPQPPRIGVSLTCARWMCDAGRDVAGSTGLWRLVYGTCHVAVTTISAAIRTNATTR